MRHWSGCGWSGVLRLHLHDLLHNDDGNNQSHHSQSTQHGYYSPEKRSKVVDDSFNVKAGAVTVADILVKDAMNSADEVVVTDIVAVVLLIVVTVVCDVIVGLLEANVTVCDIVVGLLAYEVCEAVNVDMLVDDVVVCVMFGPYVEDTIVDFAVVVTGLHMPPFWHGAEVQAVIRFSQ
ncbi:hypothetical protein DPMN_004988 [Dreissena polymorpha]|uniref:Uncharacterized protein n=1 Tax=Dreissena polymorpha TaxID=45954 RepID=A0A9D4MSM0_DREPO|nr:hypothetical protein DPMN_004988 [Dreissena polymorpha]